MAGTQAARSPQFYLFWIAMLAGAGVSVTAAWTRIVTVPPLSFIAFPASGFRTCTARFLYPFLVFRSAQRSACKDRLCEAAVQPAAKPPHWLPNSGPRSRTKMRVLRRALIAVPLTVLSLVAAPAWAEPRCDARVGFSAERVLVIDGQSYVGRM